MTDLTALVLSEHDLQSAEDAVARTGAGLVAGYALGDLAALLAAGVLAREDALAIAGLRERLIDHAAALRPGGLLAVLDDDARAAAGCLAALSGCELARFDDPGRVVLAGDPQQIAAAAIAAEDLQVDTAELDAPAALHTGALTDAAEALGAALADVSWHEPRIPVLSALAGNPVSDPRAELVAALIEPVWFKQTARALRSAGASCFVTGCDDDLPGLIARTVDGAQIRTLAAGAARA